MIVSIAVIVFFQAFWLYKNYKEEKRLFIVHGNILFRESIFKLQASKLHLDTNINIRVHDKEGIMSMTNVLQEKIRDSSDATANKKTSVVVSVNQYKNFHTDSVNRFFVNDSVVEKNRDPRFKKSLKTVVYNSPSNRVFDFLIGVDSLQDSITVNDISNHYRLALSKESIHIPFHLIVTKGDTGKEFIPPVPEDNSVTLGFTKPVIYQLEFENISWYIVKRLGAQIFFSFVLVGLTIFSFLSLYRNWQQQRKLTLLKNDFISNITHELKTPISTVSVAIEALKNFNALQDHRRTQEYLDISSNELQRLSMLVDKVLKLSMFEKEQIELKNEYFDMQTLIQEIIESMRLQFGKFQAQVSLQAEGKDFNIMADKMHITSVIFNLLDNALKYSKPNPSIQITILEEPQQLRVSITDNGIGIPAAYQDKIFDKFFRVPTGDKHNIKGYGLGLSYVSYVLARQGGSISVESKEGIGSSFTIIIPKTHEQD